MLKDIIFGLTQMKIHKSYTRESITALSVSNSEGRKLICKNMSEFEEMSEVHQKLLERYT